MRPAINEWRPKNMKSERELKFFDNSIQNSHILLQIQSSVYCQAYQESEVSKFFLQKKNLVRPASLLYLTCVSDRFPYIQLDKKILHLILQYSSNHELFSSVHIISKHCFMLVFSIQMPKTFILRLLFMYFFIISEKKE